MCKCKCHCSFCYNCKSHRKPVNLETAKPWIDRMKPFYFNYDRIADKLEANILIYKAYKVWHYYQTGKVI